MNAKKILTKSHTPLAERRSEFFANVWNHADDAFQMSFDERRLLDKNEIELLQHLARRLAQDSSDQNVSDWLRKELQSQPKIIEVILQIIGLTRNKILQDIRARAGEKKISLSTHRTLWKHDVVWAYAGPYLLSRLRKILVSAKGRPLTIDGFEALNQATWPGYIRQERAKRSGHEAEYRIALLLDRLGIDFVPAEKKDNPLCPDAQWKGISFDLMIPDIIAPLVCIKSTVHTANIGQYGESKDHLELIEAKRAFSRIPEGQRPKLVAFIDGIGFRSNRAGLDGVLLTADEFCQFQTLWKLVVIVAAALRWHLSLALPKRAMETHKSFFTKYQNYINIIPITRATKGIEAGEGVVIKITSK